ncbi:spondin domain-containing protein [Desertivirga brevis]|uniref:spondin domain-containing protein n=1 Tax=Desertivirga brevis TaxID=2810310 RepID=UPI001A9664D2|nr:spondin domain-containing protein [Pedobacter sp. SYSU D00873]
MKTTNITYKWTVLALFSLIFTACKKDSVSSVMHETQTTVTVENVLDSKPLVESGTFQGSGTPPVIFPGQAVSIQFSAAKGQAISFATMYGWSNDLFFAPANPGIAVYDASGNAIEGDVSSQVKLWDNGTRVNQVPGANVNHPGVQESKVVTEVRGMDAQGNAYLPASSLVKATLKYNGNSLFTLTLQNISGGSSNETPLSPGVWSVSYVAGGQLLNPSPLYSAGMSAANGLTSLAETGNNVPLKDYLTSITGIFTPLSPVLLVVYHGVENPVYKLGMPDRGQGLKALAQKGNADTLAAYLKGKPGIKAVYVLKAPSTTVLLPVIGSQSGGKVSQEINVSEGDRVAIATMYGFSNDWFFASSENGIDANFKGDVSSLIKLFDNGTALNEFPGASISQFNLTGTPLKESLPIALVPNPNMFNTLPEVANMIKVTLK